MIVPRRLLASIVVVLTLLAAACSGSSDTSNFVPLDTPAPGVLYVSTNAGDIQVITPANGDSKLLLLGSDADQQSVVDLAPAPGTNGLQALVRTSAQQFTTTVVAVTEDGYGSIDAPSEALSCLDPHTNATSPIAHETEPGGPGGAILTPITFAGGTPPARGFDLVTVACPRWTADRSIVATAVAGNPNDPSTIVTVVQSNQGDTDEVGFTGCATTPTSFSPDDQFLVASITCYSAAWENSGLYLIPMNELSTVSDLDALTKLGGGLYGRSAWHPSGDWIAAVHADSIPNQNIAQDLSTQPTGLQVIEIETLQTIDLDLADGASPFSMVWLESALS